MSNLKIANKLLISFTIVIVLAVVVGVVGIIGMTNINDASTQMYEHQSRPLPLIAYSIEYVQHLRLYSRGLEILIMQDNHHEIPDVLRVIDNSRSELIRNLDLFEPTIIPGGEIDGIFRETRRIINNVYFPFLDRASALASAGDLASLAAETDAVESDIATVMSNLNQIMEIRVNMASAANDSNDSLFDGMLTTIIIVLITSIVIAVVLALTVSKNISKPLKEYDEWMRLTAKGDIVWRPEELLELEKYKGRKDEVGTLIDSYVELIDYMKIMCENLQKVAQGDLNFEVSAHSDKDLLAVNLQKMVEDLNELFFEINQASTQVHAGARQIADGAQSLAQGSTEQAATVQQLSAAISQIAQKTKENASMAGRAANLAGNIKMSAEKGSAQMDEMMVAVKEINQSSQSISKVIKVIDDIAFQTNILALNAAVEAARAGQHGKGFAVVAEEVRNLAAKSAEAAKDTSGLIASSMEKAELGAKIAEETASSLVEIVSGINESNQLVNDIALSSEEQSHGISEVNSGIDQVAAVVQMNSATAQESAASSIELSGQSDVLEDVIGRFNLKGGHHKKLEQKTFTAAHHEADFSKQVIEGASMGDGGFGKY